jgi:DNA polymerase-1
VTEDIILVDLGSLYWRHWFARRSQFYAFSRTIDQLDYYAGIYPSVIVCADSPRNWRHDVTAELDKEKQYKANRPRKDPEAIATLEDLQVKIPELGYPLASQYNYEADDLIATLCAQAGEREVAIASEDKDLMQLVSDTVCQMTQAGVMTPAEVERKFGVPPGKIRDLLAIIGDNADNVEGCPKVGPVKAAMLLERFGDLRGICAASVDDLIEIPGIGKTLAANITWWDSTMAVKLVSLRNDCAVELDELEALFTASRIEEERGGYSFDE